MLVYCAGPLTTGDILLNVHLAAKAGNRLLRAGFLPIVPHLFAFSEMVDPVVPDKGTSWDRWMQFCLGYVKRCDAVLRLHGPSRGADMEVAFAREHGIPVYFDEHELLLAFKKRSRPASMPNPVKDCKHEKVIEVAMWPRCAAPNCGVWIDEVKR